VKSSGYTGFIAQMLKQLLNLGYDFSEWMLQKDHHLYGLRYSEICGSAR